MPHGGRGYRCVVINHAIRFGAEVAAARESGAPIVALESTIISHGLPRPSNLTVAREIEETVRDRGAVPATIGMIGGEIVVGLDDAEIDHLAGTRRRGRSSPSATWPWPRRPGRRRDHRGRPPRAIAAAAGIAVFATGGLGGVHRGAGDHVRRVGRPDRAGPDADHGGLRRGEVDPRRRCHAGAPGDARGQRRGRLPDPAFPGFYLTDGGFDLDWSVDSPAEVAARSAAARAPRACTAARVVVANPLPVDEQLDPALHDRVLAEGLAGLERDDITGKAVTPYLLAHFHDATEGASLDGQRADHPAQRRAGRPHRRGA